MEMNQNKERLGRELWKILFALLGILQSKTFWVVMSGAYGLYEATGNPWVFAGAIVTYCVKNISADFGKEAAREKYS